jgi:hypothetical protein
MQVSIRVAAGADGRYLPSAESRASDVRACVTKPSSPRRKDAALQPTAVETDVSRHLAEITATFSLPGGQVSIQGVQPFKRHRLTTAILGGTGKYAAARGTVLLDGQRSRYVFTLR